MPTKLRLKAPVRVSHAVNADDVVSVKRALADLGLYDPPGPLHGALDGGLLNGIEAFQRTNRLHVDRVVNPGGETERALNARMSEKAVGPGAAAAPARAFGLRAPVGRTGANLADDVKAAKRGLAWAGFYPPDAARDPGDELDPDFMRGVTAFQAKHGLKPDGEMRPGGETERTLDSIIAPLIAAHGLPDPRGARLGAPMLHPVQQPAPQVAPPAMTPPREAAPESTVGPAVPRPALTPERESAPASTAAAPPAVPPPALTPERESNPSPSQRLPPLDEEELARRNALAIAGLTDPLTVAPRILGMPIEEARAEAEAVAGVPIPEWKSKMEPADWAHWAAALDLAPWMGPNQRTVFLEIFAAEGGFRPDQHTIAGIYPDTVPSLASAIGVAPDTQPRDLSVSQLVRAYRAYLDQPWALGRVGGSAALEEIEDQPAATLLADTLFRHGTDIGVDILQVAVNEVEAARAGEAGEDPDLIVADGILGHGTLRKYLELMADPETRGPLLDAIRAGRIADRPLEVARADHMTSR